MSSKKNCSYLAELMMEVMPKAMQSIREEMRKGRGERLTVPQFRVLAAINRGICHNKELGDQLGVSEAAISRMVDSLVQEGLIKKGINKIDRRLTVLTLTSEGQRLYNFIKTDARSRLQIKLEVLSSEDVEAVIHGLKILQKNLSVLQDNLKHLN
ncbi:MAG: MarR family transcriptional regulator [Bacteriovorax sp.]|nr:MarR family transcriptional regulator [Bacteriovorax sp.]